MGETGPYRVALVTGATSGIGRATALMLAARSMTVYAVGRDRANLAELTAVGDIRAIAADVRDVAEVVAPLAGVEVDIVVNNAGILSTRAPFHEVPPAEIDAMIDVNLKAPMHLTRALLPGMVQRRRGHLIYVGSSAGIAPYPAMSVYGPSKAGLSLFCDNLRCDLLGTSVRVTEIVPGRVQTALYHQALGPENATATLYEGYRLIQPDHVASIIASTIDLPPFVDVSRVEVFPTDQATGGGSIVRHDLP